MRILLGRTSFVAAVMVIVSIGGHGQIADTSSIYAVITAAAEQRKSYINEFKNLMSAETKTFEIYDKKGEIKKKRTVLSTFIVYQLSKDDRSIAEYRNVVSVDSKKLDDTDKRAQDFFEEIVKVDSSKKELEKLDKEGSRYDEDISLNGLTLYQAAVLTDNIRPYFDFKLDGKERLGDREVFVLTYQQTKETPYISTDPKKRSTDGKMNLIYDVDFEGSRNVNARLRGKFWIDALTHQVWKELRVLTIQPEGFAAPAVFAENTFEYQGSDFGILTPRKISYIQYRIDKKSRETRKEAGVTFDYANFTKPDVEVESSEVK